MPKNLTYDNARACCVPYEGSLPIADEKVRTALRACAFATYNSDRRGQTFVDDPRGKRGGPYRMDFLDAATILLQLVGDLQTDEKLVLP